MLRLSLALTLTAVAVGSQQGAHNGTSIPVEAVIAQATGQSFTGILGICVDAQGHYYVSSRDVAGLPGTIPSHRLFELDANGNYVATYAQPAATSASAWGIRDLAYDSINNRIYGGLDGSLAVFAFDVASKTWISSLDIPNPGVSTVRGLAVDGQGKLWTTGFKSPLIAFDVAGAQLQSFPSVADYCFGIGYDPLRQTLWITSQSPSLLGNQKPGQFVNVFEVDPTTGVPTGREFHTDHIYSGSAAGAHVYTKSGKLTLAVIVQNQSGDTIVEQELEFEHAPGCGGTIDYTGGAWLGNLQFTVAGNGIASASAYLFLSPAQLTLPVPGLLQCPLAIDVKYASTVLGTVNGGRVTYVLPIPSNLSPGVVYMQILEFGATLPLKLTSAASIAIQP